MLPKIARALGDCRTTPRSSGPRDTLSVRERWSRRIQGYDGHGITLFPSIDSVYFGDGWGVPYSATRIRRLSLTTGVEQASNRWFNELGCCALLPSGDLLAAAHTKLIMFDARTLEERRRWDRRIPRYAATMAVAEGHQVVLADWLSRRIGIIDLDSGKVSRRNGPGMMWVLSCGSEPLLVGGSPPGGTYVVRLPAKSVQRILNTPPAMHAALSPDNRVLYMLEGIRADERADGTVAVAGPTTKLGAYSLGDATSIGTFRLPIAASRVAVGSSAILASHEGWLLLARREAMLTSPRIWKAPAGHEISATDPDRGIVLTVRSEPSTGTAELRCWAIDDGPGRQRLLDIGAR